MLYTVTPGSRVSYYITLEQEFQCDNFKKQSITKQPINAEEM